MRPQNIHVPSLALLTDLYELTMAYGYWKAGIAEKEAAFTLSFRQSPFQGGFTLACGLSYVMEYLERFQFTETDLAYLATLTGADGKPLFASGFIAHLKALRLSIDVDAVREGTVVFPHEPLLRVRGPLLQAQLLETALLNFMNFQSLIATKAARIGIAAKGDEVLEMGMRRAQGVDGALAASRAAYIGGCTATSNLLAGQIYGIPVRGTQAHSWIMSFPDELTSFKTYAEAMPNNCVFLVDTYDSLNGVRHAIEVGKELRKKGHEMLGIRLDSGDLAYLSQEARKLLDEAGFGSAKIVATNDLDETVIESLKVQGSAIHVWGVGTKLVTAYDQPALGCVYKLSALRNRGEAWEYKIKLSEQSAKISTPGILQVRRFENGPGFSADVIYDETIGLPHQKVVMIDPLDPTRRRTIEETKGKDLLIPVLRQGKATYVSPPLIETKQHAHEQLSRFHTGIKRFLNPHRYPVGLEAKLHELKVNLTLKQRGAKS
jgi:nicotinate phosphoribosyltransferase